MKETQHPLQRKAAQRKGAGAQGAALAPPSSGVLQLQKDPGVYFIKQAANLRQETAPYTKIATLAKGTIVDAIAHANSRFRAGFSTTDHTWVGTHEGEKGWVSDDNLSDFEAENTKTNRGYKITHSPGRIEATQSSGDENSQHSGYLEYNIEGAGGNRRMVLSHIQSTPEIGSGLGSVLVYHMARLAQMKGITTINIDMAAPTAIGFYEHMGWAAKQNTAAKEVQFLGNEELMETLTERDQDHRGKLAYLKDGHTSAQWQQLGAEGQAEYVNAAVAADAQLDEAGENKRKRELVHQKAVAEVGLTAPTHTILAQSLASVKRSWK